VVVGSGAGGGVVAARLAARGRSVLVLEGADHQPEAEMPVSEGEAWREMLLDRGATSTTDLAVTILAGATLGGGTTVNWTTTIRTPRWAREEWEDAHGLAGFAGAEGDRDFALLEDELDLQPPTIVPPKDRLILDGARTLGWEAAVTARNAGPCADCGGCTFGCARGSKRSGLRIHLADAERAGARILAGAGVTRLVHTGGVAVGVVGHLGPNGRPFSVRTPRVVVSAGGLRTPVVLERSGLGHPAIGRNLHIHPTVAIAPRLSDRVEMWSGPLQAAASLEFARPGPASGLGPAHGGFVIEAAPPHPGLVMAALPWAGRDDGLEQAASLAWRVPLIGIIRDHGAGRVKAAASGRARIAYRLDPRDGETAQRALVEMSRLARAGGATEVLAAATPGPAWRENEDFDAFLSTLARIDVGPNRLSVFSAHQMGTARSGVDPRTSATDPWGRVRADASGGLLRGAYVADGSLFPSAPGVNPMLSVMALAERVARAVLEDEAG
jgi:choline dehydrogenase-like flavoprotein